MKVLFSITRISLLEGMRSPVWHRNVLINLFFALSFIYLAANLVFLGFVLDDILLMIFPRQSPLETLNSFLLYYFFADALLRYFLQKLPAMTIQPYMHLPVRRRVLIHYLLVRSAWHPINLLHLLVLIPFMAAVPFRYYAPVEAVPWSLSMIMLVFAQNYFALYLKRASGSNAVVYMGMVAVLAGLIVLEYLNVVVFTSISKYLFNALFQKPWTVILCVVFAVLAYGINFRYLRRNMYLSRFTRTSGVQVSYVGSGVLSRFGLLGKLAELDLKFIWRNKRPKSVLLMTILFLGYGLVIFPMEQYQGNYLMYMIFSILITGMFVLNYGQYLLGWEGTHFDHILTRNVSFRDFYGSKFVVFAIITTVCMILSIPYVYFGWKILFTVFCVYLYNMGIGIPVTMFFGSFNPKKIDLGQGTVFNMQGVSAAQFLLVIPVMGIPMLVFGLGTLFFGQFEAICIIGATGLIGLAGMRYWMNLLAAWLRSRRHEIADDFRNS